MGKKRSNSSTGPRPTRALKAPKKLKLEDVEKQLNQAASDAFAVGHPTTYDQANVVMLHFDNDDIGVGGLEDELAATFEKEYGFDVEKVLLPGKATFGAPRPGHVVLDVISKLEEKGALGEKCLVILVFSGHGLVVADDLEVGGAVQEERFVGRSMTWKASWADLFKFPCSVLQILDCCYAAQGSHPSVEMLAATSATESAASSLDTGFTQCVIKQLQSMNAGTTFSISEFVASMIENRAAMGPEYFPVYGPRSGKHSIVLNKVNPSAKLELLTKAKTRNARVLIVVHMEETLTQKDLNELKHSLLAAAPRAVEDSEIGIEGCYASFDSASLVFSLPVAVWLQLPEDEAYQFITHS